MLSGIYDLFFQLAASWVSWAKAHRYIKYTVEDIKHVPAFIKWTRTLHSSGGLVGSGFATVSGLAVPDIFFFGRNPGLVRLNVSISSSSEYGNKALPGAVFMRGPSVALLIIDAAIPSAKKVVMIEQPRVPVAKVLLEIPAGMLDSEDCFRNKALDEAFEETGIPFFKEDLIDLGEVYVSPGGSDESVTLFATHVNKFTPPNQIMGTEDEMIRVKSVPLEEAYQTVQDGKFWLAVGKAKVYGIL